MADNGNGDGGGDVVDRPEDEGGQMELETKDRVATMEVTGQGATIEGEDGEGPNQRPEIENKGDRRVRRWTRTC